MRLKKGIINDIPRDNLYEIENWENVSVSAQLYQELRKLLMGEEVVERKLSAAS